MFFVCANVAFLTNIYMSVIISRRLEGSCLWRLDDFTAVSAHLTPSGRFLSLASG